MTPIDWRNPDYIGIFAQRLERLARIRAAVADEKRRGVEPNILPALHAYYRANPIDFIDDWGVTFDPRNVGTDRPAIMPFILFQRQREFLEWCLGLWSVQERGYNPKSRDVGISWLIIGLGATLCLFNEGLVAGYGSRKEEYVDKLSSPKSLFYKARVFVRNVPWEFRGLWRDKDAPYMRVTFPQTGSVMTGEAGDGIGRGDRTSIYFVDESAHLERPELIEASLSNTTKCRIDVSSANGTANSFYQGLIKAPARRVFYFRWQDDPRKDAAWYAKMCEEYDAVTIAQEVDIDFTASVRGVVIPAAWVKSAVDAHRKLKIVPSGLRRGALDVADEGVDLNAFGSAYGVVLESCEEWSGSGADLFKTTERAFALADQMGLEGFTYDADGLGAGVRGDARVINEGRPRKLRVDAWRGSGEVLNPDDPIPTAAPVESTLAVRDQLPPRTNKDYFANYKAQSWYSLRVLFQITHRAVQDGAPFNPDNIISLPAELPGLDKLMMELSQACFAPPTATGKMVIDKTPAGSKSPNKADVVVQLYSPKERRSGGIADL